MINCCCFCCYRAAEKRTFCVVYFATDKVMHACIRALHGTQYKGQTLRVDPASRKQNFSLRVTNIPAMWLESEVVKKIREVLGTTEVKRIGWKKDHLKKDAHKRFIHIDFYTAEAAYTALEQLNSYNAKNVKLNAAYSNIKDRRGKKEW